MPAPNNTGTNTLVCEPIEPGERLGRGRAVLLQPSAHPSSTGGRPPVDRIESPIETALRAGEPRESEAPRRATSAAIKIAATTSARFHSQRYR